MILRRLTGLLAAAVIAAAGLAGCGGGDEKTIPRDEGATLLRLLRDARDQAGDPEQCDELQRTVSRLQAEVQTLPDRIDRDTRRTLVDGVNNLAETAESECEGVETTETTTTPTTETAPPPTTTEEEPPPTTTEEEPPPTTTEEEPPPPAPEPPDVPGNGNGGNGNGNGSGGIPPGQAKKDGKGK